MAFIELNDVEVREPVPGYKVRFVHSEAMTFAYWDIEEGAALPEHAHPHEQVATMLEGKFELVLDGEPRVLEPGMVATIPPDAPHAGRAVTHCRILDVFHPIREDYR